MALGLVYPALLKHPARRVGLTVTLFTCCLEILSNNFSDCLKLISKGRNQINWNQNQINWNQKRRNQNQLELMKAMTECDYKLCDTAIGNYIKLLSLFFSFHH